MLMLQGLKLNPFVLIFVDEDYTNHTHRHLEGTNFIFISLSFPFLLPLTGIKKAFKSLGSFLLTNNEYYMKLLLSFKEW